MEAARHFISAANGDRMMASDLNNLEQALQTYFDGLYEGDTAKLGSVFHDVAHLFYVNEGKLGDMSREQWFDMVRSRKSAQSQDLKRHDWVVQIDRSGPTTAFAKVQCQIPPRYFTDYLTFVKLTEGWRIVSKTFHTETH
jgi:Putative lumazine-binding